MSYRLIERHSSFKVGYHALELQLETGDNFEVMDAPYPAAADLPKAYVSKGQFTDLNGANPALKVICGGVPFTLGGFPVVTILDQVESATKMGVISSTGPAGIWLKFDNTDAANVAKGAKLYMIPDATATTGGLLTTQASGNIAFGRCLISAAEYAAEIVSTAAVNVRPIGYWVKVQKLNW